jgi:hypothetical protein
MDTMKLIKAQVDKALSINKELVGLEDVVTHILQAEHLLNLGLESDDKHYFTDVIYRTNHAYEGVLKEAYFVLAEKVDHKITPNNIEQYFLKNKILNERVVTLLENYRKDWRNTSTHDYRLFFNSGEAFLAILSVTAFIHLLLIQILDKLFYLSEMARLSPTIEKIKKKFNQEYAAQNFVNKVKLLLKTYDGNLHKDDKSTFSLLTEREFIQGITAHINSLDSSLKVLVEPTLPQDRFSRPDLIIENDKDEKVLVELKVYKRLRPVSFVREEINQVLTYLTKAQISDGILLLLPRNISSETELEDTVEKFDAGTQNLNVHVITEKSCVDAADN